MKKLKIILISILIFAISFSTGCDKHIHNYQFYIASEPTCTSEGKAEGICSCGEKIEQTIPASHKRNDLGVCSLCNEIIDFANHTHRWIWQIIAKGTCTEKGLRIAKCNCGMMINETLEKQHTMNKNICIQCGEGYVEIENNKTYGHTIEDIIDKAKIFGYSEKDIYECYIYDLKFDALNVLHATVSDSTYVATLSLTNQKVNFNIVNPSNVKCVSRIFITDYKKKLNVVLVDGTTIDCGYIEGLSSGYQNNAEPYAKSIFINQNNLLLVVYNNNTVKIIGKIATTKDSINGGQLIYKLEDDSYSVMGTLDDTLTKIIIPDTHRGLPVKKVKQYAFSDNEKITEVVLGANVETVEMSAFENCKNLTKVTFNFNNKLNKIDYYAFKNTKLQNLVIPSSVSYLGDYCFGGTSDKQIIFLSVPNLPSIKNVKFINVGIYYSNQWEYVNGVPTIK